MTNLCVWDDRITRFKTRILIVSAHEEVDQGTLARSLFSDDADHLYGSV